MAALQITITDAGRAEIINAENTGTDPVTITEIGLGTGQYTPDSTQTTLTAETKRLNTISGEVVSDDTIHVTVKDEGTGAYDVAEFGLYTASGTLFAVYSQPSGLIMQKAANSSLLLAVDVILSTLNAASLTFGDTSFSNPPASETTAGVAEIATQTETNDGTDDGRIVTPKKLLALLAKYLRNDQSGTISGGLTLTENMHSETLSFTRSQLLGANVEMNNLTNSGFYDLSEPVNGPGPGWWYVQVQRHSNDDVWVFQQAMGLTSEGTVYQRWRIGAVWQPWRQVLNSLYCDLVGATTAFSRSTPPAGWLKANGATVSRTAYAKLFAAIGTYYGAGDGVSTFNLPDLRGEFIRGWDEGRGVDPNRIFGSLQLQDIQSHSHNVPHYGANDFNAGTAITSTDDTWSGPYSFETSQTGGAETRPRNVALLYCIKY